MLERFVELAGAPVLGLAALATALAALRREWPTVGLAAAAAAWVTGVSVMAWCSLPRRSRAMDGQVLRVQRSVAVAADLRTVVNRAGGPGRLRACGRPRTGPFDVPLVAWTLDLPNHRLGRSGLVVLSNGGRQRRAGMLRPAPRPRQVLRGRYWTLVESCRPSSPLRASPVATRELARSSPAA